MLNKKERIIKMLEAVMKDISFGELASQQQKSFVRGEGWKKYTLCNVAMTAETNLELPKSYAYPMLRMKATLYRDDTDCLKIQMTNSNKTMSYEFKAVMAPHYLMQLKKVKQL